MNLVEEYTEVLCITLVTFKLEITSIKNKMQKSINNAEEYLNKNEL